MELKNTVPSVVSLSNNILLDEELENGILDEDRGRGVLGGGISNISMEEFSSKSSPISDEVRKLTPFLSPKLSLQLFVYGAVLGRLVFILSDGYQKGNVSGWRKDEGARQILGAVLNEKELEYIYSQNVQGFNIMTDLLETKILNEMSFMLSGQKSAEDALAQVARWTSVIGQR